MLRVSDGEHDCSDRSRPEEPSRNAPGRPATYEPPPSPGYPDVQKEEGLCADVEDIVHVEAAKLELQSTGGGTHRCLGPRSHCLYNSEDLPDVGGCPQQQNHSDSETHLLHQASCHRLRSVEHDA